MNTWQKTSVGANNLFDKITLVVPPRRPVEDIIGQLRNELGIAKNIKNDETRNNVIQALNTIIEYIYAFVDGVPPEGLILNSHKDKIVRKIPKKPVNINLYRCDDHYFTYMGETL